MCNFPVEPQLTAHWEFPDLQTPTGNVANLLDAETKERERNNETDRKQSDENKYGIISSLVHLPTFSAFSSSEYMSPKLPTVLQRD